MHRAKDAFFQGSTSHGCRNRIGSERCITLNLSIAQKAQHKKLHAVFVPAIPRVGEDVTPENGSAMRVVGVDHVTIALGESEGLRQPCLVPHILLEAIDDE